MTVFREDISGRVLAIRIDWSIPKVMPCTQACIGLWSVDRCFLQQAFLGLSAQAYCRAPQRSVSESCSVSRKDEGFAAQVIRNCSARKGEVRVWRALWAWWLGQGLRGPPSVRDR
jgi:hypothetical protein